MAKESRGVEKQKIPATILKIPTNREIHQYLNIFWFERISCSIFYLLVFDFDTKILGGNSILIIVYT